MNVLRRELFFSISVVLIFFAQLSISTGKCNPVYFPPAIMASGAADIRNKWDEILFDWYCASQILSSQKIHVQVHCNSPTLPFLA